MTINSWGLPSLTTINAKEVCRKTLRMTLSIRCCKDSVPEALLITKPHTLISRFTIRISFLSIIREKSPSMRLRNLIRMTRNSTWSWMSIRTCLLSLRDQSNIECSTASMNSTTRNSRHDFPIWMLGTKPGLTSESRTRDLLLRVGLLIFALVWGVTRSKRLRRGCRVTCSKWNHIINNATTFKPGLETSWMTREFLNKSNPNIKCKTRCISRNSRCRCSIIKCRRFLSNSTWCHPNKWTTTNTLNISTCSNLNKFKLCLHKCPKFTTTTSYLICRVMKTKLIPPKGIIKTCQMFNRTWSRSSHRWTSVIRIKPRLMRYNQIWALLRIIKINLHSISKIHRTISKMKKVKLSTSTKCSNGTNRTWTWI